MKKEINRAVKTVFPIKNFFKKFKCHMTSGVVCTVNKFEGSIMNYKLTGKAEDF